MDFGMEFGVVKLLDYLKGVGVEWCRTMCYNLRANEKAERLNRTLKLILIRHVNNKRDT